MVRQVAFIGFGEAGRAFAAEPRADVRIIAYDIRSDEPTMLAAYSALRVEGARNAAEAIRDASAVFSLVTADQALAAAAAYSVHLPPGAIWMDMNSVAPATKRAAEAIVTRAGGRYVDVALMGPVEPARRGVPALVSGAEAEAAAQLLRSIGFSQVRVIDGAVGRASTIKMLRSVIVKGIEALTAECFLAAREAGVEAEVAASLDAGWPGTDWRQLADYNLGRMRAHGARRAAEMEEVAATLDSLGGGSEMARATALVQRRLAA